MTSLWGHVDIRSDKNFDPSEKLLLGYFSITVNNQETESVKQPKMLFNEVIMTSSGIKN